jgi:hypothetical protein
MLRTLQPLKSQHKEKTQFALLLTSFLELYVSFLPFHFTFRSHFVERDLEYFRSGFESVVRKALRDEGDGGRVRRIYSRSGGLPTQEEFHFLRKDTYLRYHFRAIFSVYLIFAFVKFRVSFIVSVECCELIG